MPPREVLQTQAGFFPGRTEVPPFCRKERLTFRFALVFQETPFSREKAFLFVKRLLKLFPFERLRVEVETQRVRDVFSDWDSYLEWVQAEPSTSGRLFKRLEVWRFKKCLGYFEWKDSSPAGQRVLEVFTEGDQSNPFLEVCRQIAVEENTSLQHQTGASYPLNSKLGKRFYDWALSFFNSSVRRGTTSKRSATKP